MNVYVERTDEIMCSDGICPECLSRLSIDWEADGDSGWPDEIECPVCGSTLALEVEWTPTFYIGGKVGDERT